MRKKMIIILLFLLSIGVVSAAYTFYDPLQVTGLTVDEFKDQCVEVTYKDLKTNDSLINQSVKLTGEVFLASSESMTFHVDGDMDQSVYVHLYHNKDNSKFKKYERLDDTTIYCRFDGINDGLTGEEPELTIVDIE